MYGAGPETDSVGWGRAGVRDIRKQPALSSAITSTSRSGDSRLVANLDSLLGATAPTCMLSPETVLCLGDRRVAARHGARHCQHRIAGLGLVLEPAGESPAADVLEDGTEALGHGLVIHLEGT